MVWGCDRHIVTNLLNVSTICCFCTCERICLGLGPRVSSNPSSQWWGQGQLIAPGIRVSSIVCRWIDTKFTFPMLASRSALILQGTCACRSQKVCKSLAYVVPGCSNQQKEILHLDAHYWDALNLPGNLRFHVRVEVQLNYNLQLKRCCSVKSLPPSMFSGWGTSIGG